MGSRRWGRSSGGGLTTHTHNSSKVCTRYNMSVSIIPNGRYHIHTHPPTQASQAYRSTHRREKWGPNKNENKTDTAVLVDLATKFGSKFQLPFDLASQWAQISPYLSNHNHNITSQHKVDLHLELATKLSTKFPLPTEWKAFRTCRWRNKANRKLRYTYRMTPPT